MEKYLFTDGTNGIREAQSREELHTLVQSSAGTAAIRIWIFNTSEWISWADFSRRSGNKAVPVKNTGHREVKKVAAMPVKQSIDRFAGPLKFLVVVITAATIFLIYNFSRVKWHTASALLVAAGRPANSPVMDLDSLVRVIESSRGQKLDKVTWTNLRIRNSWPERIELKLKSDRDFSQAGKRFYNVELSIDNSTGYTIDNAVIELKDWKNSEPMTTDTFHFSNIGYADIANRQLINEYSGDSLSVSFLSIRSRAFNFCYSFDKESNYGNLNDRWFCRE